MLDNIFHTGKLTASNCPDSCKLEEPSCQMTRHVLIELRETITSSPAANRQASLAVCFTEVPDGQTTRIDVSMIHNVDARRL